ncbi:NF-kappa-B inhibitor delta-like isoform X2 [Pseudomyrmex gracilis]|uniref:NF-kappa-B inhibitor delta-like isoform X2 n=1 Tax=Pseudomyrmex gracilis TaxID=219809 RepID=UPI000995400A|nr:NF-kappa-B inhibitor delta-like isoform X2 [Pseudomyrmex gracilis]
MGWPTIQKQFLYSSQDTDSDSDIIDGKKRKRTLPLNLSKKKPKSEWAASFKLNKLLSDDCACVIMRQAIYLRYRKGVSYDVVCDHKPIKYWFLMEGESKLINIAIDYNDTSLMRDVLHSGTTPNCRDHLGRTPLHYAVFRDFKAMIRLLILHGADTNMRDDFGLTPLETALKEKKDDIALLISTCCELKAAKEERDRLQLLLKCKQLRDRYRNLSNKSS